MLKVPIPKKLFKALMPAMCTDEARENIAGIHVKKESDLITLEATTGWCAIRVVSECATWEDKEDFDVVVRMDQVAAALAPRSAYIPEGLNSHYFPDLDKVIPSKPKGVLQRIGIAPNVFGTLHACMKPLKIDPSKAWVMTSLGPLGPYTFVPSWTLLDVKVDDFIVTDILFIAMPCMLD